MLARTLLTVVIAAGAAAGADTYSLQWRDLDRMVRGREVSLTLPSGTKLRGTAVRVDPEELLLDIRRTSDKHAFPKGRRGVPRALVGRIRVQQKHGYTWRAVGAGIGGAIGILIAIPVVAEGGDAGRCAVGAAATAGLGWLLGWSADQDLIDIVVEPGPAAPPPAPHPGSWTSYLLAGAPDM